MNIRFNSAFYSSRPMLFSATPEPDDDDRVVLGGGPAKAKPPPERVIKDYREGTEVDGELPESPYL